MGRTLLLGHTGADWRSWLKQHRNHRDLILLDPADASHGALARLCLIRGEKTVFWRFYGSLDAARSPHVLIASLAEMLSRSDDDVIVQLFPMRGGPLSLQAIHLCSQIVKPIQIVMNGKADVRLDGLPATPEVVDLDPGLPEAVRQAQRKALWLKLVETCVPHEVDLRKTAIDGARLGSGHRLEPEQLARMGLSSVLHAETCGGALLLIADVEPDDHAVARALDLLHCGRAHVVHPEAYRGLLCSFARLDGEDFGMGFVQEIDFSSGRAQVMCDAVPPAPVKILRLGSLRIDREGRELGEARPWQV